MSPPAVAPWQRLGVDGAGARSSWRARIVNTEVCCGPGGPLGDLTSVWRPLAAAYVTDLLLGPFFSARPVFLGPSHCREDGGQGGQFYCLCPDHHARGHRGVLGQQEGQELGMVQGGGGWCQVVGPRHPAHQLILGHPGCPS